MLYLFKRLSLLPASRLDVVHAPDEAVVAVSSDVHAIALPTRGAVAVKHSTEQTEAGVLYTIEAKAVICPKASGWQPPTCVSHILVESIEGEAFVFGSVDLPMVVATVENSADGRTITFSYKGVWPLGRVERF